MAISPAPESPSDSALIFSIHIYIQTSKTECAGVRKLCKFFFFFYLPLAPGVITPICDYGIYLLDHAMIDDGIGGSIFSIY